MKIFAILILLILPASFTYASPVSVIKADSAKYAGNISKAVNYLQGRYSPITQLLSESEDSGQSWLSMGEYKNNFPYTYQQVMWIWSDNGFAVLALEPWNSTLSQTINRTIQSYNVNEQGEFLTVAGVPIQQYREVTDTILVRGDNYAVVTRNYNGAIIQPNLNFADEALYYSLSEFEKGNVAVAQHEVMRVASWWNSTCLVDAGVVPVQFNGIGAPTDSGFCPSNRLGLLLFTAKVVNIDLGRVGVEIEKVMWSHQIANGGISSLATGNGLPYGTANCESTSTSLLSYNLALIKRIQTISANAQTSVPEFPSTQIFILTVTLILMASMVLIRKVRKREL